MSKILVIEDDAATRLFLKRDLQLEGYDFALAKDGLDGLEQAKQSRPALIICDWVMPGLDGVEVCRQIKADPKISKAFFILLTSREGIRDRVVGLDSGADEFLSKPVDPSELLARVRAGLRQYHLTQELSKTNSNLNQTLERLKQTQARLIQSEKMSGLGQMVAGVAHEINNPVTFIDGNLGHASEYIDDLLRLVHLYRQHYRQPVAEIAEELEAIDVDFLASDLTKLLSSMKMGAQRIRQIVLNLRNFSRLDEAEMKEVNLHEGLDNTLMVVQHRWQSEDGTPQVDLEKHYGDLPPVQCYAAQLNQVFLNIIANAIDFLEAAPSSEGSKIWIRTEVTDENWVRVSIRDNGPGMSDETRSRIFDPFFSTKAIGEGTGMGLSISYQIVVERHRGRLHCHSVAGEGTEFAIEIPQRQFENEEIRG